MSQKKPSGGAPSQDVRRTLTLAELDRSHDQLDRAIAANAATWNSHGWAVVGSKRALRVEVAVAKTLLKPAHPITPIEVPALRGLVKPAVKSSFGIVPVPAVTFPDLALTPSAASAVGEPLAPGARVLVNSQPIQRAGIACIVEADGELYAITCGHVFERGVAGTGVFTRGHKVAVLMHNFLEDEPQLDAAYCKLTAKGRELLASSTSASTWLAGVLAPQDGHGRKAVFWPTSDGAGDAVTTTINSFSASESQLFNHFWQLSLSRLVRTERITSPGDSGSLLAVGNRYYGSCTGSPGWSYFTPLHTTIERMRERFGKVEPWQPE
jgi:hypothetical protein